VALALRPVFPTLLPVIQTLHRGPRPECPVLLAHPLRPPLPERSMAGVIAVDVLSSVDGDAVDQWGRLLKPRGRLLLVDPVTQGTFGRLIKRITAPRCQPLAPETITGLMLNAGFTGISQLRSPHLPGQVVTLGERIVI